MKKLFWLFLFVPFVLNAQKTKMTLSDIKTESHFRSLSVVSDSIVWVGGSKGTVCRSLNGGENIKCKTVPGYELTEFRSVYGFDDQTALIANIGSPAHILRTSDGGESWTVVYENTKPEAFINGIDFWNAQEGVSFGDPIMGKMLVLRTIDGGITWNQSIGQSSTVMVEDEASFAASGTAIRCFDNEHVIIATGGALSRLLVSENKGATWKTVVVPVIQGESSTGIFSLDFISASEGIIVGGDYKNETQMVNHVFYTSDGGANWIFPEKPTRGYRECMEFISATTAIAVGPTGIDISFDKGRSWDAFSDEQGLHVVRKSRNGTLVVMAGNSGKISCLKVSAFNTDSE